MVTNKYQSTDYNKQIKNKRHPLTDGPNYLSIPFHPETVAWHPPLGPKIIIFPVYIQLTERDIVSNSPV